MFTTSGKFVVLFHRASQSQLGRDDHWDFMLEIPGADADQALRTWALELEPIRGKAIPARALPPHRAKYLDYEGPVRGDRGSVERFDRGDYEELENTADVVRVRLAGDRLVGVARLERSAEAWVFTLLDVDSNY